jgi:magnesium transporter
MESQYSTPQMTLTNLLIGAPSATSSKRHLPDTNQHIDNADDIYRGSDPRSPIAPNSGHHLTFSPATRPGSSSSSSSSGIGFNIVPSVIEHAITRWARGRGLRRRGSSSGSSSSSSSSSSTSVASGQGKRRKKSPASLLSRTTSITTRRQARAMSRVAPREFVLFLPKHLSLSAPLSISGAEIGDHASRRELRTSSLKLVLAQLGLALKQNAKSNRPPRQLIPHSAARDPPHIPSLGASHFAEGGQRTRDGAHVAFNIPTRDIGSSIPKIIGDTRKGKGKPREVPRQFFLQEKSENLTPDRQPCWWLDIASPTWDDMRALGKVCALIYW